MITGFELNEKRYFHMLFVINRYSLFRTYFVNLFENNRAQSKKKKAHGSHKSNRTNE